MERFQSMNDSANLSTDNGIFDCFRLLPTTEPSRKIEIGIPAVTCRYAFLH